MLACQHKESLILVAAPVRRHAASRGMCCLELEIGASILLRRDFQDTRLPQQLQEFPCLGAR
jgi:hypothetical protein